ncbi:hypothetical protein [Methylorubrum thiocyanatum]|uniref:Uncharacterized protein n=1 Tax=Methylorubrum thiocyanatum TaxID=47958 RepID=A0AA40VD42_9HYPH|nr:hypothetical protein [Methylorubrum thiocyanatum]MBA8916004.1 hypothetical protein [Methylorubrum thiocyanatum]
MNYSSPGGWRERTKRTDAKNAERASKADIRAERARLAVEHAERSAAEVAALEAANRAEKLACPCCRGEGKVTVEMVELVFRALERLPSESRPDATVLATLGQIARGEQVHQHGPKVSHGLSHPAPVAHVETATKTPARMKKPNDISRFTEDGALIELDD